ncbi:ABC-F family ATP-binding cassette domain-containing protein [Parvularcula sp. ZS-1/3]|uniref:ABC-F family ATP-binding cassette domain-containing protein n=1 Tax=Parvularcula mediterranea TaxID=2732508 RepID=A0A7Y3RKZ1_9PROT|nr:ABC-F family ATP-binding cassette domain-containing protein [Parvularcula mediterranea]NNU15267.1 ABC-F family ATP-binding cassette domain-containing protein [Parvularcula mediterranea]
MLHINDLTYRIEGRPLFEQATAMISDGWKVGFTGRNGTGKSTLFKLIRDEISPDDGSVSIRPGARVGGVAQEAPATQSSLLETVLAADEERHGLLARAETETDPMAIAEIQTRLADIEAHSAEARAAAILSGLGFSTEEQAKPCAEFSGGWRMRVALAGVLFARPDLLLLDEPTNYLDLEGAAWLESYIAKYPYTALIISHDRGLLNRSVTHTLALDHKKLSIHNGGYDTYARRRAEQARLASMQAEKIETQRAHMQAFVDRFKAKASKAKQAQSRVKAIEKLASVDLPVAERTTPFHFPSPKPVMAPPIVRLEQADIGYEEGNPVLRKITLRIDSEDRIAILGANGQGKSTLVKAVSGRLAVMEGNLYKHKKLKIAYFAQHQLDELKPKQSPFEHVRALMPDGTEAEVRSRTAQLGFGAQKADTKVEKMSGGEKARLLFGLITFDHPHMMILDEPTNHLDIDSRDALIEALNAYEGAVLLITHDAHLAEAVADRLWEVKDGDVLKLDDSLDDYRARVLAAEKKETKAEKPQGETAADRRRDAAEKRKALQPLKRKVTDAEKLMEKHSALIEKLDGALADPSLYEKDPAKAASLNKDRADAVRSLEAAEESWLEASAAYEEAQAEG